ncbi:MAG: FAD-dependent oxidoreductase [Candidatus Aureabacteria bacterium]|nr:FAD-dependent oxidoreductase [Candidatus Auribacterota bacterium]
MIETKVRFSEKIDRTETTISFRFRPKEKFNFLPGQFLQVVFDEEERNNKKLNKYLSFSCAPDKDYIEVTKRISTSDFSKRLCSLIEGDEVLIKGPMGNCVLDEGSNKIGFLTGGIGITPIISMLEYIDIKGLQTDVILFYSNRIEQDIAFMEELNNWENNNKNIKVIYTVVDCEPKDKKCFFGMIDKDLVETHMSDYKDRIFFVFGPPAMVTAMKNICNEVGCIENTVKTENFVGY